MFEQNHYNSRPSTPATTHLIIINILMLLATFVFERIGVANLNSLLGMHYWEASDFKPFQMISYMFMHADISHLFFNMFSLYVFGRLLELTWGSGRFIVY